MNKKSRKSLDDLLADEFVYGTAEEPKDSSDPPSPPDSSDSSNLETAVKVPEPESALIPITTIATPEPTQPSTIPSALLAKLQTPDKEATIRFTVDLPTSIHRKLSIVAARTGQKKADIVRVLLAEAFENVSE
jgi:hypothetical protein